MLVCGDAPPRAEPTDTPHGDCAHLGQLGQRRKERTVHLDGDDLMAEAAADAPTRPPLGETPHSRCPPRAVASKGKDPSRWRGRCFKIHFQHAAKAFLVKRHAAAAAKPAEPFHRQCPMGIEFTRGWLKSGGLLQRKGRTAPVAPDWRPNYVAFAKTPCHGWPEFLSGKAPPRTKSEACANPPSGMGQTGALMPSGRHHSDAGLTMRLSGDEVRGSLPPRVGGPHPVCCIAT